MSYTTHIPSQIRRTNNRHNTVRVTFIPFPSFVFVLPSFSFLLFLPFPSHPHSLLLFLSSRNSFLVNTHIHHTSFHLFLHVMICNIILSIVLCVMSYPGPSIPPTHHPSVPVFRRPSVIVSQYPAEYPDTPRYQVKTFKIFYICGSVDV